MSSYFIIHTRTIILINKILQIAPKSGYEYESTVWYSYGKIYLSHTPEAPVCEECHMSIVDHNCSCSQ